MKTLFNTLVAWGPLGVLIMAVLDSAGIPLPGGVDVLLVMLSATNPSRGYTAAVLAIIGSVAGNVILFYIARKGGEAYLERHYLSPRAQRFRQWFQHYGLLTVFIPALIPIPLPLKIFVISAGALGVSARTFVLTVIAARIPRYFALAYLGARLGENSMAWFRQNAVGLTLFAAALFAALYAAVKVKDRMRARAAT
ncbi:MAG TPA: VTT domain-containing protein [Bryobacteraceae bacterium]|nr:VTT domain-containing protein [Bryobacteraceae bacterium]